MKQIRTKYENMSKEQILDMIENSVIPDNETSIAAQVLRTKGESASSFSGQDKSTGVESDYQSEYGVARKVSMFISLLGGIIFSVGIIIAFMDIVGGPGSRDGGGVSTLSFWSGLGSAVSGLFLVASGQISRATVDNADHTREILNIIKSKA